MNKPQDLNTNHSNRVYLFLKSKYLIEDVISEDGSD